MRLSFALVRTFAGRRSRGEHSELIVSVGGRGGGVSEGVLCELGRMAVTRGPRIPQERHHDHRPRYRLLGPRHSPMEDNERPGHPGSFLITEPITNANILTAHINRVIKCLQLAQI